MPIIKLTPSEYDDEIVLRSAPRWAWNVIDETLAVDVRSIAFDPALRSEIASAVEAMVNSCENPTD